MSLYTNTELDSLLNRSKSNLYNKVRVLFVSHEEGIDHDKVYAFLCVSTKQANLIGVMDSIYSSESQKQTAASLLNQMSATSANAESYFAAGYTSNY